MVVEVHGRVEYSGTGAAVHELQGPCAGPCYYQDTGHGNTNNPNPDGLTTVIIIMTMVLYTIVGRARVRGLASSACTGQRVRHDATVNAGSTLGSQNHGGIALYYQ